ncbi:MAG: family 43 glycosylhydrolase [Actinomycetota bacterium]
MALEIPDRWVWDFWLARDCDEWHAFFLHAPKSPGDMEARNRNARIGHAVSRDLRSWDRVIDPFPAGPAGEWDDLANWTGSIVRAGNEWWMFYTGVSTVDEGKVQRIGAAVSSDLRAWEKVSQNPLSEAGSCWYEKLDSEAWYEEAWRDPWVFSDPDGDGFHMFVTARAASGLAAARGVIGHATSSDLLNWTAQPPVTKPSAYGHMEVPQQVSIGDRHYLLFCAPGWAQPGVRDALTGTGYLVADNPLGPYQSGPTPFVFADRVGSLYAGKIVETEEGLVFLATENNTSDGTYVGKISDPLPVIIGDDGALSVGE